MKSKHFQRTIFIVAALALSALARTSQGQITGILSSDVEGFFGTQSDAHQASEAPLTPPWAASGVGPYPITGPANVPSLYAGFPNPVFPVVQNISYAAPAGHANAFAPDIQGTRADYFIKGGFGGTALFTRDAYVSLGALSSAGGMHLAQPNTATGYAYEQTNFAMDYLVGAGGIAGGAVAGLRPFLVTGHVTAGGYAQFGAEINYWWIPATYNTGAITITGVPVNLGALQYHYLVAGSPGPFAAIVTQTSAPLLGAVGTGILEITGDVFVAGDPFDIAVIDAPEPSSAILLVIGLVTLGWFAFRRRRVLAACCLARGRGCPS